MTDICKPSNLSLYSVSKDVAYLTFWWNYGAIVEWRRNHNAWGHMPSHF